MAKPGVTQARGELMLTPQVEEAEIVLVEGEVSMPKSEVSERDLKLEARDSEVSRLKAEISWLKAEFDALRPAGPAVLEAPTESIPTPVPPPAESVAVSAPATTCEMMLRDGTRRVLAPFSGEWTKAMLEALLGDNTLVKSVGLPSGVTGIGAEACSGSRPSSQSCSLQAAPCSEGVLSRPVRG
jgi:hypothetical protein